MSAWIPALHAGMTESRIILTEALQPRIFKGVREGREEPEASNQKKCFRPLSSYMESFRRLRKFLDISPRRH
jgi:hypothetical protein